MGSRALLSAIFLVSATSSLAFAGDDPVVVPDDPEVGDVGPSSERAYPTRVWVDESTLAPDAIAAGEISNILFINRCIGGCQIKAGVNDARFNTSSIVSGTSQLSEFAYDDATFDAVLDCVKDVYSPYDVVVTAEDPGEGMFHHEAILAGAPEEVGLDSNIGGIAPASCNPLNNVISFSFANRSGGDVEEMCWTVAQESAHSFGLPNHVLDCHDPMTYIPGCERKYFRNKSYPCGEFEERPCMCGGITQNSHIELRNVFGDGVQPPPPTIEILAPAADADVNDGFSIYADASDPRLVDRVELWFNGTKVAEKPGNEQPTQLTYSFGAPDWPDGYINVEFKAYNDIGSEGVATVRVLKGSPCADASSCLTGQECNAGACEYPAASSALGESCAIDQNCIEGSCASNGGESVCAASCNPSVEGSCSDGFSCLDEGVCWPEETEGGCCSVAGGQREGDTLPWMALALFAGAIVLVRRRRRA